jgi:hypothetical protein
MEEMKRKLFGDTSKNTAQDAHSATNNNQKGLPYFETGQQNTFTSNLSSFNNSNKPCFFNQTPKAA